MFRRPEGLAQGGVALALGEVLQIGPIALGVPAARPGGVAPGVRPPGGQRYGKPLPPLGYLEERVRPGHGYGGVVLRPEPRQKGNRLVGMGQKLHEPLVVLGQRRYHAARVDDLEQRLGLVPLGGLQRLPGRLAGLQGGDERRRLVQGPCVAGLAGRGGLHRRLRPQPPEHVDELARRAERLDEVVVVVELEQAPEPLLVVPLLRPHLVPVLAEPLDVEDYRGARVHLEGHGHELHGLVGHARPKQVEQALRDEDVLQAVRLEVLKLAGGEVLEALAHGHGEGVALAPDVQRLGELPEAGSGHPAQPRPPRHGPGAGQSPRLYP